ncbi:uncharacterized protein LOC62_01G000179 [Vanrija pseudolonga]|uniref:Autophagy-related protein 16 domain-containing protein n=1 Tax=Vanrija pseudolonga TaxID=143232 RepID=A0AAF0XZ93_9TREE|nr:hypothetical protein LOC62_01G000179 [Vanrija pseudolonga]
MSALSASGPPEWQNTIRARLLSAQHAGEPLRDVIEQCELLSSLDSQINQLRSEMQTLYRTQAAAQNKQLAMADALRDRDEEVRGLREEVRELRDARDSGARRERNLEERYKMREEDVKILHDEILAYQIEISGLGQRNSALQADNASLLQRWLDKMNLTAEEMNSEFERESSTLRATPSPTKDEGDFRAGGKA